MESCLEPQGKYVEYAYQGAFHACSFHHSPRFLGTQQAVPSGTWGKADQLRTSPRFKRCTKRCGMNMLGAKTCCAKKYHTGRTMKYQTGRSTKHQTGRLLWLLLTSWKWGTGNGF